MTRQEELTEAVDALVEFEMDECCEEEDVDDFLETINDEFGEEAVTAEIERRLTLARMN